MNKKQPKRRRDIKSKLLAAVCMLLVSTIMMISSTYAWFTLSTAPEVKGIQTAVGANGNLEMALLPKDGQLSSITSAVGDSTKAIEAKNVTWGNLVDVSDDTVYGLDKITLFPSALNAATTDANGNPTSLAAAMLATPTYGADGRPSELVFNTVAGYYDSVAGNFAPNAFYGVRAVGTASGMTDRQLDYRNARSAANTAKAQAANQASQSLNTNGSALANIAIKYGMNTTGATFGKADVESLRSIINDLKGTDGVFDRIETAYMQYILAYAASAASGTEDTAWNVVKGLVETDGATLETGIAGLNTAGVTLPDGVMTAIGKYQAAVNAVNEADTKLQTLESTLEADPDAQIPWADLRGAMAPLADPAAIKINSFAAGEVKENLGALVSSVTAQGGLKVIMSTGAGVYADIADQCGNYTASITIEEVEYNGIVLNNMAARMETATTINPVYLDAVGAAVEGAGAPASGAVGTMPITDMYGFIVDLAFRTNAADSKLLLQVDAADRIYNNNTNEQTLGGGSSMTFQATTPDFTDDQVKALMSAIRVVFFDPTQSNKVIVTAKLDTTNAVLGADGWTAKMYLYTLGENGVETKIDNNEIMPLIQNQATALSALVYLDGNLVGNDDVAATASTSMTGKMNLQFASSATLVPMEYAELNIPANNNP